MVLIPFTNSIPKNFFCKHQYRNPDKETKEPFCCRAPNTHDQKGHWPCYYQEKEIKFNTLNREIKITHNCNEYSCEEFKPLPRIKNIADKIPTDLEVDAHKRYLGL